MKPGYACMPTNRPGGVLYCVAVTDDLAGRVEQHRGRAVPGFTRKYDCHVPASFASFEDIPETRQPEHRLKKWNRACKTARIVEQDAARRDLSGQLHG